MKRHAIKLLFAIRLAALGALPGVFVPGQSAAEAIPPGRGNQTVDLGGTALDVYTYRPQSCAPTELLVIFHGDSRNVDGYRTAAQPIADRWCMIVLTPLFDAVRFPGWRYQFGGIARGGAVQPAGEWTGNLVLQLIEWARRDEGRPKLPYALMGFSAGAQFVSRFAAFIPNTATRIVVDAASTYVTPALDVAAPYGFKGIDRDADAEQALRRYLAEPILVVVGTADTGTRDLDMSDMATQQGGNRHERAVNLYNAAAAAARARGTTFNWRLIEVPALGHAAAITPEVSAALEPSAK